MTELLALLNDKKKEREDVFMRYDPHVRGVYDGDQRDTMLKQLRKEGTAEPPSPKRACVGAACPDGCKSLREDPHESVVVCEDCGTVVERIYCDVENPSCSYQKFGEGTYSDGKRRKSGGYRPLTHFTEIIGHFQGKRSNCTPKDIVDDVRRYCDRYRYKPHNVRQDVVRFFLKRMQQVEKLRHVVAVHSNPRDRMRRYTDYYKHAPEITYKISGIPPPYMTPKQVDRVLSLFPIVIAAYKTTPRYQARLGPRFGREKSVPNNPNNLFIFYKICQLLGYEEFLPFIPLPKSTDNIDDNDENGWKYICQSLGWPYIATR